MIWHKKGTGPRVKNAQKTTLDVGGKPHTFPSKAEAVRYLDLERMQEEKHSSYCVQLFAGRILPVFCH